MKKILVVVPDLDLGGVTTSAINFCNELIRRGHEVELLNMNYEQQTISGLCNKVKIKRLERKAKYWGLGREQISQEKRKIKKILLYILGGIKRLTNKKQIWMELIWYNIKYEQKYDIAIAFKQCSPCYHFVLKCIDAERKIGFIHGSLEKMGDISSWSRYFGEFDYISCVSNAVRRAFEKAYPKYGGKFKTVYNMMDSKTILKKSEEKSPFKLEKNICNIITVTRIEEYHKKVSRIPEICLYLKKKNITKFHWYVVGDGPDLGKIIDYTKKLGCEEFITYCGALSNPYTVFKESNFSVLTSESEGYGMVIKESLILGKPVVASRYPALNEILEDGVNGFITEQSVVDLGEKVAKLINNEDNIRMIMENNINKNMYSNDLAYSQIECLIT